MRPADSNVTQRGLIMRRVSTYVITQKVAKRARACRRLTERVGALPTWWLPGEALGRLLRASESARGTGRRMPSLRLRWFLLVTRVGPVRSIAYEQLASALLGPQYGAPFARFKTPLDLEVLGTAWYKSNFASHHGDLARSLAHHAAPDGWILEVGSFVGSSAITLGRAVRSGNHRVPIVCMDTWMGDVGMWLAKGRMLGPQGVAGEPRLRDQFMSNVAAANLSDLVIPVQAPAMVGLRYVNTLIRRGTIPAPSVIYIDTAHEYPETSLEMQEAWEALAPGGILMGDDFDKFWPQVQQSVNEFVALRPPSEFGDITAWAAACRKNAQDEKAAGDGACAYRRMKLPRMKLVSLVQEPTRAEQLLPLLIKEPRQWLLRKAVSTAMKPSATRSLARMKVPVRCCLSGWADPRAHDLGRAWCSSFGTPSSRLDSLGVNRSADCAASTERTAWYTKCLPRRHALQQSSCSRASKRACPVYFACRAAIYLVNGQLSSAADHIAPVGGFA